MFSNTQSCDELGLTWFGCPKCGQPKWRVADWYQDPGTRTYIPSADHVKKDWQDQIEQCVQCHHKYDRKEGFIKIADILPALRQLIPQNNIPIKTADDLDQLTYLELRGVQIAPIGNDFWSFWKQPGEENNKKLRADGYYTSKFMGIWLLYRTPRQFTYIEAKPIMDSAIPKVESLIKDHPDWGLEDYWEVLAAQIPWAREQLERYLNARKTK